jgi:hypothetical protein
MSAIPNKKWLSDQILSVSDNYYLKNHFYKLLYMMCVNRFIWKGLPSHIDTDFIEKELANVGELAFINHEIYGLQVCYCIGDNIGMYGKPTRYLCYSPNNKINDYFNAKDIVIIRNNMLSENSHDFINRYASIIAEIQKTKEVNLNGLKTPILVECEDSELLTMKNLYADFEGNAPVIYGRKGINVEGLKVLKLDVPNNLESLQSDKIETINECLNFMGINTTPRKKERMVSDEARANKDFTSICLAMFLNSRLKAIEEINEKFGSELKTKITIELAEYVKDQFETIKEGENNE